MNCVCLAPGDKAILKRGVKLYLGNIQEIMDGIKINEADTDVANILARLDVQQGKAIKLLEELEKTPVCQPFYPRERGQDQNG